MFRSISRRGLFLLLSLLILSGILVSCDTGGEDLSYTVLSNPNATPTPSPTPQPTASAPSSSSESSSSTPVSSSSGNPVVSPTGGVAESARAASSYFDDAVFVGDSVSLKLMYYVYDQREAGDCLGDAKFLTSGSLGSGNALWDVSSESVHPTYQGEKMLIQDAVAKIGAKKLYIMLGMNDIGLYGVDESIKNFETLISKITEKSPGIKVYAQSVTPKAKGTEWTDLNNGYIAEYNQKLLDLCNKNGWYYINVTTVLQDADGYLPLEYCSDPDNMGIHFTDAGCQKWIDYLYTHTA